MPFLNGVIMTPFVISSIMVGNAMTRASVCKNELEYPKLPVGLSTLPHYKHLSTLPEDNINLRQKIIPREETTRNNVYKVCWSDLVKKKEPNRHFSRDECRGWSCKVSGDKCGNTPEKPEFTCVNQPNPGLCKDPPCWFGNDGNRTKFDNDLLEDEKFLKLKKKREDKKKTKNEEVSSEEYDDNLKMTKCPDDWENVGDGRCKASESNRGICDEIVSFDTFSDSQKIDWAKKCQVKWNGRISLDKQKSKRYTVNGLDSTEDKVSAVIYSEEDFKGDKMEIPMGGGHCPDLEDQDPDVLWDFTKDKRVCESSGGKTFSGNEFASIKLHPDYQLTAWKNEGFRKGALPPITVKDKVKDLQYEIGPTTSYVVCKKSEADKKGNCKRPGF